MRRSVKFSPEVRECAVRMVMDAKGQYEPQRVAIESVAGKIGCTAETLRCWVRRHERDTGQREGVTRAVINSQPRALEYASRSPTWDAAVVKPVVARDVKVKQLFEWSVGSGLSVCLG
ncbi:MAG: transposase [Burkholderiaceae bacterium]